MENKVMTPERKAGSEISSKGTLGKGSVGEESPVALEFKLDYTCAKCSSLLMQTLERQQRWLEQLGDLDSAPSSQFLFWPELDSLSNDKR